MPIKTKVAGVTLKRGERMTKGKGWRLVGPNKRAFKATLIQRLDIGDEIIAIFRVLPHPDAN